ncbi:MlaD family protein [Tamlana sp. 2_MG-2023]|uniref:MlaD family protein n=1 Tax=unclassified Tamlana TaxID=2614803 RepID=UPI0026E2D4A9|nr:MULTISPECIES: MlaD family protein [unclassified Tamlana]MDO6759306.1 MlaD family protein [Tamlana sp. 2_MG-2023]MDO6790555.1 MlaD family protein [Tamlana sp. 1_MG-2023]
MKISREVKTAILVIVGIILFIFGFNFLKGNNLLDSSKTYYTEFKNVEGLAPSTPVTISGLNVGKVSDITFKNDGSGKLVTEILIESDFEFSKNSTAELYDTGLLGGKAVAIIPAFDGAETAESGTFLKSRVKEGMIDLVGEKLEPIQEQAKKMITNMNVLIGSLNEVLNPEAKESLKTSIAELSQTMNALKKTSQSLNQIVSGNQEHLDNVLSNADEITTNLSGVSKSLADSDIVGSLESTLGNFNLLVMNLQNGQGTMGKLLKDETLYNNLEAATSELEDLIRDIKLHPNRYTRILSKKEIPYEENEESN